VRCGGVRCRGKPACLPICGDIRNTNVGALPATPIRHDMHNMRRCVAGRTSLHKGKRHGEQGRHSGLPLHGHTDMTVAKSAIGVTALGALQATPLQSCPRTPMMESPHDVGATFTVALVQRGGAYWAMVCLHILPRGGGRLR
jgi:hypothetical protein